MIATKFQIKWPCGSKEVKNRFSHGGYLGYPIGMILAIFDLRHTKFRVNLPFDSGEVAKNRFSSIGTIFSYF